MPGLPGSRRDFENRERRKVGLGLHSASLPLGEATPRHQRKPQVILPTMYRHELNKVRHAYKLICLGALRSDHCTGVRPTYFYLEYISFLMMVVQSKGRKQKVRMVTSVFNGN